MILSAQTIRVVKPIHPFYERTKSFGMTFGLGPAGYDVRIRESLFMWPGRFVLASTIESFEMPKDVLGKVCDKSTWVRRGLSVHNTVIEPGWRGFLTLELKVVGTRFFKLHAGMPIAQIIFHKLDETTESPYRGKYQDQRRGVQQPIYER